MEYNRQTKVLKQKTPAKEKLMAKKKAKPIQCEAELNTRATAELKAQVAKELEHQDRALAALLEERHYDEDQDTA